MWTKIDYAWMKLNGWFQLLVSIGRDTGIVHIRYGCCGNGLFVERKIIEVQYLRNHFSTFVILDFHVKR